MGVKSWSRTAANNVLANIGYTLDEGQAPSSLNDSIRSALADLAREWFKGTDVASAGTIDLTADSTTTGGFYHITGTTTITAIASATAGIRRRVVFDAALTLTHNATSLILPGGASITTAAGDCAEFVSEGSGNWRCTYYSKASGAAVSVAASGITLKTYTSASGTSVDFTSIPSTAKRITVMFNGVSTNGTANHRIQLGVSGTPETSGYNGSINVGASTVSLSNGFDQDWASSSAVSYGLLTLTLMDSASNTWAAHGMFASPATSQSPRIVAGVKSLAGVLNMIRVTTSNGTDAFDAGSINVAYE